MSFYNTNILILVFCSNPFMTFRHKMRHTCGASPYDNGKRSFHKFKTRGLLFKEVPQTLKSGIRGSDNMSTGTDFALSLVDSETGKVEGSGKQNDKITIKNRRLQL